MLLLLLRWTVHAAATLRCVAPSPSTPGKSFRTLTHPCGPERVGWRVTRWLVRATPHHGTITPPHHATPRRGTPLCPVAERTRRYAALLR
jgi:hypothetical protein